MISHAVVTMKLSTSKTCWAPFQYKHCLSRYKNSHFKDKIVERPSYVYNRDTYTDKMTSSLGNGAFYSLPPSKTHMRLSTISPFLSGVPDFFDRNKILSGFDLSHYQVPHCIRVFFYFVWFVFIHHNFQFYFKLCTYCNILDIYLS